MGPYLVPILSPYAKKVKIKIKIKLFFILKWWGGQKSERKISEHLEANTQTTKHSLDVIPLPWCTKMICIVWVNIPITF